MCCDCSAKEQNRELVNMQENGKSDYIDSNGQVMCATDSIGWRIPAVPTQEGDTYWGYSSVPQDGVEWWVRLPLRSTKAV